MFGILASPPTPPKTSTPSRPSRTSEAFSVWRISCRMHCLGYLKPSQHRAQHLPHFVRSVCCRSNRSEIAESDSLCNRQLRLKFEIGSLRYSQEMSVLFF